jgi:hypothetical protein
MRRLLLATSTTLVTMLALAPLALAHDGGEGIYGQTNDKVVARTGFILIFGIPIFIFLVSMLQRHLEHRKDARLAATKARAKSTEWSRGW